MEQNNLTAIKPLLEIRAFVYDLLRQTFLTEPRKEFLAALPDTITNFPFINESQLIKSGTNMVSDYLNDHPVSDQKEYDTLHWDYTRMFIGPYTLPAPPWESVYLNKDRLLFQAETLQVRHEYLKYQFLPQNFQHEADDHIGLELDFMYQLAQISLSKLQAGESDQLKTVLLDQARFLQEHLLKWVPEFAQNVEKSADTAFYQGMAKILLGYLELDLTAIQELLDMGL